MEEELKHLVMITVILWEVHHCLVQTPLRHLGEGNSLSHYVLLHRLHVQVKQNVNVYVSIHKRAGFYMKPTLVFRSYVKIAPRLVEKWKTGFKPSWKKGIKKLFEIATSLYKTQL